MTPGDIIQLPSGRRARYEGGSEAGALFTYVDEQNQPRKHRGTPDTFCLRSMRLLTILNDQVVNGKRGVDA